MKKNKAIFLDRDGTIIKDLGYLSNPREVEFFPDTIDSLRLLQKTFLLFIITNQSGISKGITSAKDVKQVNDYLVETLCANGIRITDVFCCPHDTTDNCICKKPKPYFINLAARLYNINLAKSYIIGDHPSDVECGINSGINPVYVLTGHGKKHRHELTQDCFICNNIRDASKLIDDTINCL